MLEITRLTKFYGAKKALDNVNLTIQPGELIGLFGENGAGKTTLMKSVLGFLHYEGGTILLDGEPVTRKNIGKLSFATSEHSFFPNLSPEAHGEFYGEHFQAFREKRFHGLLDFFQLPKNKPVRSFSMGQKNQFEVIMSLCQGADYILMDEPFAGNDIFNREDFYKVLLGILEPAETVILATHLIEEVSGFLSRAVLIHEGRIVGDVRTADLDEQGVSLMDYVKRSYHYRADRVSRALDDIAGEPETPDDTEETS